MKKKEYQTGTASMTKIESGWLSNLLAERASNGWTLFSTFGYFSQEHQHNCLFWILERNVD